MNITTKQIMSILKDAPTSELTILHSKIKDELNLRFEAERAKAHLVNSLSQEEKTLISEGLPIKAIKSVRDRTGLNLVTCRDIVNIYRNTHKCV